MNQGIFCYKNLRCRTEAAQSAAMGKYVFAVCPSLNLCVVLLKSCEHPLNPTLAVFPWMGALCRKVLYSEVHQFIN